MVQLHPTHLSEPSLQPQQKVKVLYIAGYSFSGTTILANILGQLEGFFSAGELRCTWEENLIRNYRCGCGAHFRDCSTWSAIFDEAFGGIDAVDAQTMVRLREGRADLPTMILPGGKQRLANRLQSYLQTLEKLYQAIPGVTGSRIIVDSSKSPLYGYMLGLLPNVDLYVVHVVRDPRAVQYSCLKRKDPKYRKWRDHNPLTGCLTWSACNLTIERFWQQSDRYLQLHYETFAQNPRAAVEQILDLVQENVEHLPISEAGEIELHTNHTAIGNDNRFKTGTVALRLDERWKSEMKPFDQLAVSVFASPLCWRYGYFQKA